MTRIQVLGPGCQKCKALATRVEQALKELGIECNVEKVTDINAIIEFGIMATPALAVDGTVLASGHVPSIEKIKEMLT